MPRNAHGILLLGYSLATMSRTNNVPEDAQDSSLVHGSSMDQQHWQLQDTLVPAQRVLPLPPAKEPQHSQPVRLHLFLSMCRIAAVLCCRR